MEHDQPPLSARDHLACGRRQVCWLPACLSPRLPELAQWPAAAGLSGHSGGSAPDLHRLPFATDPFITREHNPGLSLLATEPYARVARKSAYEPKRIRPHQEEAPRRIRPRPLPPRLQTPRP